MNNEMLKFRDSIEKLIFVSELIRQTCEFNESDIYFLQLEIDDLKEQYKKISDKIECLV